MKSVTMVSNSSEKMKLRIIEYLVGFSRYGTERESNDITKGLVRRKRENTGKGLSKKLCIVDLTGKISYVT